MAKSARAADEKTAKSSGADEKTAKSSGADDEKTAKPSKAKPRPSKKSRGQLGHVRRSQLAFRAIALHAIRCCLRGLDGVPRLHTIKP